MRTSTIVMIAFAVLFGLLAVFVAQSWLNSATEQRMRSLEANKKPLNTSTIVVASKPLRYGTELTPQAMREVAWPEGALPAGTFATIADAMSGGKRIVLAAIEQNEPILRIKITGAGQNATLSAVMQDGMQAVTIRVNDVDGVGGFVLPGDQVDVVLTRQDDRTIGSNEVVLQNARVLAVDQLADERPTGRPWSRRSRSRSTWLAREDLACGFARQSVADASQGRRNDRGHARAASRSTISPAEWRRRTTIDEGLVVRRRHGQ